MSFLMSIPVFSLALAPLLPVWRSCSRLCLSRGLRDQTGFTRFFSFFSLCGVPDVDPAFDSVVFDCTSF